MATKSGDREAYFPAIEKKYGQPMTYWFDVMAELKDQKYPEQIAYLKENYGFSQAHANAIVMYSRGSKSSKRFNNLDQYLKPFDATKRKTVESIFKAIQSKHPKMELVIAWNQPMLRMGKNYVFGVSVSKNHILIAPWSTVVLKQFTPKLSEYQVNKKTFAVPLDWKVDSKLLIAMVKARLAECK